MLSRVLPILLSTACVAEAADFEFYGRSGDLIELNFASLPGVPNGATFSALNTGGFLGHSVLTSDALQQGAFATTGRLWIGANPLGLGDTNPDARSFQGTRSGSVQINGETKTFNLTIQPGYTGAGAGAVQQSFERVGRAANNPIFVAQQQQRLRYLGFRRQGGGAVNVSGTFDTATDQALQTFQAAFDGGVNATQTSSSQADGIVGPTSAAWLNAANAPTWDELIDPDPQTPGTFSVSRMIGDFDILPGRDPGTGVRSGRTPQSERFGTSWTNELFIAGSAAAKQATGVTQLMNGISTEDGYGSAAFHSTHRVGMDIDIHVDGAAQVNGNGSISSAERDVIDHALAFANAPGTTGLLRVLSSNTDIINGINAQAPGLASFASGHFNHLHLDVRVPARQAGLANVPGDFNLDNVVDAADYSVWRDGLDTTLTTADYTTWVSNFGRTRAVGPALAIPEPAGALLASVSVLVLGGRRRN